MVNQLKCSQCSKNLTNKNWYKCFQKKPQRFLCKFCSKERVKRWGKEHSEVIRKTAHKWYLENRTRMLDLDRENRHKIRKRILEHYSHGNLKCECCGETHFEFLTVDDIEGKVHKNKKLLGGSGFYVWLEKQNFPEGFRVLCMNCNFSKGKYGYCPHEKEIH